MYKVELEKFEGPLDLLLQLIEGDKLDVCELSLSKITDTYLSEIEKMDKSSDEMSEFIVIATKLLYIKSKQLLPNIINEEDEKEIADLEAALSDYQKYKEAAKQFEMILSKNERSYSRKVKTKTSIRFVPPKNMSKQVLWRVFNDVLSHVEPAPDLETIKPVNISIDNKKFEITKILKQGKTSFKSLFTKHTTKTEIIVTFLAILEMIKQKEITVTQGRNFSDFAISGVK